MMTAPMILGVESVILCEGYDDQQFWAELLQGRLGFRDPRKEGAVDPFGKAIPKAQHGHIAPGGHFVRVVSCGSREKVFEALAPQLERRKKDPLRRLVVSVDCDAIEPARVADSMTSIRDATLDRARRADSALKESPDGAFLLDGGATTVSTIAWWCDDDSSDLPRKQTLERLVCAALREAHPARAAAVHTWLQARPDPPFSVTKEGVVPERRLSLEPKEHAHSHFAGWFAEHGSGFFFRAVWQDDAVAAALTARLRKTGAWRAIESLGA
ncbi:MAG: hypothetical protein U0441_15370 [Polyangiaceae bacterium]